jgi:hypothetical protein
LTVVEEPSTPYTEMIPFVELFPDTHEMPLKTMPFRFVVPSLLMLKDAFYPATARKGSYETQKKKRRGSVAITMGGEHVIDSGYA